MINGAGGPLLKNGLKLPGRSLVFDAHGRSFFNIRYAIKEPAKNH
jgi:hypothetical protein